MNGISIAEVQVPPLVRLFLRQEYSKIDPALPRLLEELTNVGAGECWHKKSTFKEHLYRVYQMLKVWGQNDVLAHCGLIHSAYSNSYVNLAIFKPDVERSRVCQLVGEECEQLIHLFCVVPRHDLIYTHLLDKIGPDGPLAAPSEGITVKHIKTGEPLHIDLATLSQFLVLTMVDFSEQLFSWQDDMFENSDGRLRYAGNSPQQLWPGEAKPGRWMATLSRMGAILRNALQQLASAGKKSPMTLPAVFDNCSVVLSEEDELSARDDYWRVVTQLRGPQQQQEALEVLERCVKANPFIAEPHLLAAQIHMHQRHWDEAAAHAHQALRLFCTWGTPWDKRLGWEVWIAYSRVILQQAQQHTWPTTPFGMLNVGLVDGI